MWPRGWGILLQCRTPSFDPWVGQIPWRREWLLTPEFFPGESYGQRSLAGYSPRDRKEVDMTEWLAHTSDHQAFSPLFLGICNHTTLLFGEGHFLPLPMPMKCQLARALYSGKSPRRKSKNQGKECSEYFSCRHASPGWSRMGCLIRGPGDSQCSVSCFFSLGRRTL